MGDRLAKRTVRSAGAGDGPASRQEEKARWIIRGGAGILVLATLAVAAYRLPIIAFRAGWISQQPSWYALEDVAADEVFCRTPDGREFTRGEIENLKADAAKVLAACERIYPQAKAAYGRDELVEALAIITPAFERIGELDDRLAPVRDLRLFAEPLKRARRLGSDIGMKYAQWRRQLTFEQAEELQRRAEKQSPGP